MARWRGAALLDRGESLTVIELAPDGTARGEPIRGAADERPHWRWADIVPTSKGALCVWAEETAAGTANLLTGSIGTDGKPRGMPARVARGVSRWAAVASAEYGVGLALVSGDDGDKRSAAGAACQVARGSTLKAERPEGPAGRWSDAGAKR